MELANLKNQQQQQRLLLLLRAVAHQQKKHLRAAQRCPPMVAAVVPKVLPAPDLPMDLAVLVMDIVVAHLDIAAKVVKVASDHVPLRIALTQPHAHVEGLQGQRRAAPRPLHQHQTRL